ncbi:MAG: trans-sulfuration enzyme family protein [Gammaproteobacteria bacterium]
MPHPDKKSSIETLAVHAGRATDKISGAVTPSIQLSTTFERDADGGYSRGYEYIRNENPNRGALEESIAALERGDWAVAFSSGTAATATLFQAAAKKGVIVSSTAAYHGTLKQLRELNKQNGGSVRFVDSGSVDEVENVLDDDVSLLFIETPANPMMGISNIRKLAAAAARHSAAFACDNTFATPVLQNPLTLGADLVVHSATKYLGGHSDLMSGVVAGRSPGGWSEELATLRATGGAVPSPFDCWLLQRSLPTLPVRVRTQSAAALLVANFCTTRPEIENVLYPGLPAHPGHRIAAGQMSGFGGMLSIRLAGGDEAARGVAARVRLFTRATSLGGVESLIEHRASIEGPDTETPDDLLRLSIGLEHPDDLIADLAQALDKI